MAKANITAKEKPKAKPEPAPSSPVDVPPLALPENPMATLAAALHNARQMQEARRPEMYHQFVFGNR